MDYNAIAQQYGAVNSKPAQQTGANVDYNSLANKFGAVKSQPPAIIHSANQTPQTPDSSNPIVSVAKSLLSPVATLLARPIQAGAELLGASDKDVNDVSNSLSGRLVAPTPQNFGDVKKDIGRGVETVALGLGPIAGGAAFGAGNSLEQGNELLSAQTAFQTVLGAAGGKVLDLVGKPLLNAAGKAIGSITPQIIKDIASKGANAIEEFAANHNILPSGISDAVNNTVDSVKSAKIASPATRTIKNLINPSNSVDEATGQIIQGGTEDIPASKRTLSDPAINDGTNKTYADLQKKINSQIKPLAEQVDAELSKDTTGKSIRSFNQTIGEGKNGVKVNYVRQGIDDLNNFYSKTGDAEGLSNMKAFENNAKENGLTYKDVNDLARLHGKEINAFNANGEAASGLSKQAAENTRMGIKRVARQGLGGPEAKALDSRLSDLYDTKALVDKQVEKVNSASQKSQKTGIIPKLIGKGIKIADTLSGNPLKSIGREIGTVGGSLSPTEIEGNLSKNLKILRNEKSPSISLPKPIGLNRLPLNQGKINSKVLPIIAGGTGVGILAKNLGNTSRYDSGFKPKLPPNVPSVTEKEQPLQIPNEKNTVGNYNMSNYASNPKAASNMQRIYSQMSDVSTPEKAQSEIDRISPNSNITGKMIIDYSDKYDIEPKALLSLLRNESNVGALGLGLKTNNAANILNTDNGKTNRKSTPEQGVDAAARELYRRRINKTTYGKQ